MKKFLLSVISICCLFVVPMHADAACGDNFISFSNSRPNKNEYIYELTSDFDKVYSKYPTAGTDFTTSGSVWECGSNSCAHHSGIIAPAGHAWDNHRQRGERFYWCNNALGDSWQEYDLIPCDDSFYESLAKNPSLKNGNIDMNGTSDKMVYRFDSNRGKTTVFCYTNPERVACVTTDGAQWFDGKCQCLEQNGVAREWNGTTCVAKSNATGNSDSNSTVGQDNAQGTGQESVVAGGGAQSGDTLNQTEKCIRSRCGGLTGNEHSQCITCCYVPASVAVWNSDTRMCECADNQKIFNPSTLQCETSSATAQQSTGAFTCDANVLQQITSYTTQYADNASITTQINNILVYCSGDAPNQIVFNNMYNQLMVLINQANTDSANAALNARITVSRTNISNAIKSINDASATLDVSKWRNTEGNFNTSRLLSDSIAGVVLGTAGGLITSHVVKNGQIENGFEDLQCTVGGQVVANWNDQFRVGIQ